MRTKHFVGTRMRVFVMCVCVWGCALAMVLLSSQRIDTATCSKSCIHFHATNMMMYIRVILLVCFALKFRVRVYSSMLGKWIIPHQHCHVTLIVQCWVTATARLSWYWWANAVGRQFSEIILKLQSTVVIGGCMCVVFDRMMKTTNFARILTDLTSWPF